jgi:hypothetical protein
MTLLKNGKSIKVTDNNLSIRDGWQFGLGFGLAMTIAIPLILILFSCLVGIGLLTVGSSLGALWP